MSTIKVISREYKIMLKAERFFGEDQHLLEKAHFFWNDFVNVIDRIVYDTDGDLDTIKTRRLITFFDTATFCLRNNVYVFRERVEIGTETGDEEREVTLKFRHPDRYLSGGRNMAAADGERSKTKFEEDIKPPFGSLFSHSTKQSIDPQQTLQKMSDIAGMFPDLNKNLDCFTPNETITAVGGFTAREVVITGGDFQIGRDPKVEAEW
jgi:hypothetical protein